MRKAEGLSGMSLFRKAPRERTRVARAEIKRFLELNFPNTQDAQLRLLILHVFLQSANSRDEIIQRARRWDISPDEADRLMRGEVEFGFRWYSIEGVLTDCGAQPDLVEVARELFHGSSPPSRRALDGAHRETDSDGVARESAGAPGQADEATANIIMARPDPLTAQTVEELVQLMAHYRIWAGRPSYRRMTKLINGRYATSTLASLVNRRSLPSLDLVVAYLEGCGANSAEVEPWTIAWRRIALEARDRQ